MATKWFNVLEDVPITTIEDSDTKPANLLCFYNHERDVGNRDRCWLVLEFESNSKLTEWFKLNGKLAYTIYMTRRNKG